MTRIKVAPSILAADWTKLGQQISELEVGGADYIHVDVMDGHFVPNLTGGINLVEAARRSTSLPLDVHLMIDSPERYLADFKSAGADLLSIHLETGQNVKRNLLSIKELGCKAGIALNPTTSEIDLKEILEYVDLVVVLTVNPGFGAQKFIDKMLNKIERVREMLDLLGSDAELEVDGGIGLETGAQAVLAGANVLVAGTSIFKAECGIRRSIEQLRNIVPFPNPTPN
jgi:ribulose-phosphate 3-epimerase